MALTPRAGRHPRRGQDVAVVDVEDVSLDRDGREPARELQYERPAVAVA